MEFLKGAEVGSGKYKPELNFAYELIVVIASQGQSDLVMDAARAAGAGRKKRASKRKAARQKERYAAIRPPEEGMQCVTRLPPQALQVFGLGGISFRDDSFGRVRKQGAGLVRLCNAKPGPHLLARAGLY